jgi:hypothetical protein
VKFAIKLYHYHNAAGAIAPPVFVIADETMDAEAFSARFLLGDLPVFRCGAYIQSPEEGLEVGA